MKWVSAAEVIAFHDRILAVLPGVAGMPDAGRAEAIIYRVQNRTHYKAVSDVFELAATYMIAIARGHIFNDGNIRTALFVAMAFLGRNGVMIADEDNSLVELTVQAATGDLDVVQVANELRQRKVLE